MNKLFEIMRLQFRKPLYKVAMIILGFPTFLVAAVAYFKVLGGQKTLRQKYLKDAREFLEKEGVLESIKDEQKKFLERKYEFLNKKSGGQTYESQFDANVKREVEDAIRKEADKMMAADGVKNVPSFITYVIEALKNSSLLFVLSVVSSFPLYLLMLICVNDYSRYTLGRLCMLIFVIFGVVFLVFTIMHLSPFDPARSILGESATAADIAKFNETYGLDKPYLIQLFNWFRRILTFDLGNSFSGNEDVLSALARKFPVTLKLALFAAIFGAVVSIPLGVISAMKRNSGLDYFAVFLSLLLMSVPQFWLGMIMILNFSIRAGWLPSAFKEVVAISYIMPAIGLSCKLLGSVTRQTRSSMLETNKQDYIVTARAKGLSNMTVIMKHTFLNALIPIITTFGLQFGSLLGGSAVEERVFSVRGIGDYIINSVYIPDIPIVLCGVVYLALIIGIVNLVIDLMYAVIDPRVKASLKNK